MKAMICRKVPMPDGCHLATDVWLPDGPGPFPVLLTRTPYHRAGMGGAKLYTQTWGYAYVVQDTRGKHDSEGAFRPLEDEQADGQATLDWVADQSWCNGRIGMVGKSYLGIVQIPAAGGGHEALKCIVPGVAPNSFFVDWIRYDGCFSLANIIRWPMTHAVCRTKPVLDHFTWEELWRLPTLDAIFERAGSESPTIREWAERDAYDDYWARIDQHRMYPQVKAAGLHVGGWFDHLTRGQFQAYQGIRDNGAGDIARANQRLLIGAWGHSTIGKGEYGDWDFGPEAVIDENAYERRFVDLWLRDIDDGISDEPPVTLFVMGANRWMRFDDWPVPGTETQTWHLRSGGNANTLAGDGRLSREAPDGDPPDRYRYDPADPVPTLGGPVYWGVAAAGPVEQRPILSRQDVLYYRSEPLPQSLSVVGEVNLDLWIASDAPDTDFIAKLCVVEPMGRVTCLTFGSLRCRYRNGWDRRDPLAKDEPTQLRIQMGNLAYVFPAGSRIALMITSSSMPRILPHPNTMAAPWADTSPQVACQTVLHDRDHVSRLHLPVVQL